MTSRAAYAMIVYGDAEMNSLGFDSSNVFAANAATSVDKDRPFIVIVSQGTEKSFGITGVDLIEYWVHQPKNIALDYSLLDNALTRIRELLVEVVHFSGSDGWTLSGASWVDTSRDLTDDAMNTLTKFSTFRVASRNVVTL